ncbi:hypothetical protein H0H92_009355 [Tricholoma furcatifolium]|nr:hypothetical protein H0H92_009355 [Tricholoma furcatifolium]
MLSPLAILSIWNLTKTRDVAFLRTKVNLVIILLGLIAALGDVISDLGYLLVLMRESMILNIGIPLDEKQVLTDVLAQKWDAAGMWCQAVPLLLNDALIIWRGWVLFAKRRWALGVLLVLWIAAAGTLIAFVTLESDPTTAANDRLYNISVNLSNASAGLSILDNVIATSLIGYILWGHLRVIRNKNIQTKDMATFKVWRILLLLVEIGFAFCVLQALFPALVVFLIQGPFSISEIHETATAVYEPQRA